VKLTRLEFLKGIGATIGALFLVPTEDDGRWIEDPNENAGDVFVGDLEITNSAGDWIEFYGREPNEK
jgi:hypothetical protein